MTTYDTHATEHRALVNRIQELENENQQLRQDAMHRVAEVPIVTASDREELEAVKTALGAVDHVPEALASRLDAVLDRVADRLDRAVRP